MIPLILNGIAIYQLHLLDIRPIANRHILDWISDGYLVVSDKGLVISYNRRFASLFASEYGIEMCIRDRCRTARRLTAYLNKTDGRSEGYILPAEGKRIEKAPDREWYPLSPMQQGIYVQSYLDSTGLSYNCLLYTSRCV